MVLVDTFVNFEKMTPQYYLKQLKIQARCKTKTTLADRNEYDILFCTKMSIHCIKNSNTVPSTFLFLNSAYLGKHMEEFKRNNLLAVRESPVKSTVKPLHETT